MKNLIIFLVFMMIISCKKADQKVAGFDLSKKVKKNLEQKKSTPKNVLKLELIKSNLNSFENLKLEALNGNIQSYNMLIIYYKKFENRNKYFDLMPISKVMAIKYNHGDACNQIYEDILRFNNKNIQFRENLFLNLKQKKQKEALKYLKIGVGLNDLECKLILAENYKYGYGVLKNLKKSDSIVKSLNLK